MGERAYYGRWVRGLIRESGGAGLLKGHGRGSRLFSGQGGLGGASRLFRGLGGGGGGRGGGGGWGW